MSMGTGAIPRGAWERRSTKTHFVTALWTAIAGSTRADLYDAHTRHVYDTVQYKFHSSNYPAEIVDQILYYGHGQSYLVSPCAGPMSAEGLAFSLHV